ncbi:MAG: peroxiredoxin [Caldimicrobium sp.]
MPRQNKAKDLKDIEAIEFCLPAINEKGEEFLFCLKDYLGKDKDIILYFYPKDNTPGCTQEACDFRDNLNILKNVAFVVGISPDSIKSHKNFQSKHNLNFILASDPELEVIKAYGTFGEKQSYGKKTMGVIRSTFIISPEGKIKKIWKNVKVKGHILEILKYYELQGL